MLITKKLLTSLNGPEKARIHQASTGLLSIEKSGSPMGLVVAYAVDSPNQPRGNYLGTTVEHWFIFEEKRFLMYAINNIVFSEQEDEANRQLAVEIKDANVDKTVSYTRKTVQFFDAPPNTTAPPELPAVVPDGTIERQINVTISGNSTASIKFLCLHQKDVVGFAAYRQQCWALFDTLIRDPNDVKLSFSKRHRTTKDLTPRKFIENGALTKRPRSIYTLVTDCGRHTNKKNFSIEADPDPNIFPTFFPC